MKVIMLGTSEVVEVKDGYAARLLEQGRAILADQVAQKTVTPGAVKEEKAKATKNGKG